MPVFHQIAERAMTSLQQLNLPGREYSKHQQQWRIEGAKIFWCRGENDTAMHIMKTLVDKCAKVSVTD